MRACSHEARVGAELDRVTTDFSKATSAVRTLEETLQRDAKRGVGMDVGQARALAMVEGALRGTRFHEER